MENDLDCLFCVYQHVTPDGDVFYVGKGTSGRARNLSIKRAPKHEAVVRHYGAANIRVIVFPCSSEEEALEAERRIIRDLLKQGVNLTNVKSTTDKPNPVPRPVVKQVACAECGQTFSFGPRSRAVYCNDLCRQRAWHKRKDAAGNGVWANNTSGVTGVHWFVASQKWQAAIVVGGKYHFLGTFVKFEDAVAARKQAEKALRPPKSDGSVPVRY